MDLTGAWQVLIVVLLLAILFVRLDGAAHWQQLLAELRAQLPIFSAQMISGREAECIRDRLRKPSSTLIALVALVAIAAAAWWLTR